MNFDILTAISEHESPLHLAPLNCMETITIDVLTPGECVYNHLVIITSEDYCRLTEDGIPLTVENLVYDAFERQTDPSKIIGFVKWQLNKLPRKSVCSLYEYIHFSLKHDKADHPYSAQWSDLCECLVEQIKTLDESKLKSRRIQYAYLGAHDRIYCQFENCDWRIWDASSMREMQLMKNHLANDPCFFRNALTIINHTIAWDTTGDKDP